MKQTQLRVLCCLLALASVTTQKLEARDYHDKIEQHQNICLGIIGSVVTGIGVWAFGKHMEWWGALTNEELVRRGRDAVSRASKYDAMVDTVGKIHSNNRACEPILYNCALLQRGSGSISSYLFGIKDHIASLESIAKKLNRRIRDIESKHSSSYRRDVDLLRNVRNMVINAQTRLEELHEYLFEQQAYLGLFEIEDRLGQKYAREVAIMQQCQDEYAGMYALRGALMTHNTETFGLIKTVDKLQRDIASLETGLRGIGHIYVSRAECAGMLLHSLKRICEIIVVDGEYRDTLVRYEVAQREKERLRLERERVANEQRIASAREREAYAKEREARAREEQNRLKAQENRLKEQELYDNRVQYYYR